MFAVIDARKSTDQAGVGDLLYGCYMTPVNRPFLASLPPYNAGAIVKCFPQRRRPA